MTRATLTIPGVPPSLNQIGYRSHWSAGRREKQKWEQFLAIALMEQRVPRGLGSVVASAELRFTQRRRRDEGNFRALLEKALGDTLVKGRWLPDDTPDHYRFGALEIEAPCPEAMTVVELSW